MFLAATPKTGNVWLENLLSHAYGIPIVGLSQVLDPADLAIDAPAYVTHQHFRPGPEFLDWVRRERVQLLTMARHPGDVLLSLYHYVQRFRDRWAQAGLLGTSSSHVLAGRPLDSSEMLTYVRERFAPEVLGCTLAWIERDVPLVRYEDLRRDPFETLSSLGSRLGPVDPATLRVAIEQASFESIRGRGGDLALHCRSGRTGQWRDELPGEVVDALREEASETARALGYTFDLAPPPVRPPHRRVGGGPPGSRSSGDHPVRSVGGRGRSAHRGPGRGLHHRGPELPAPRPRPGHQLSRAPSGARLLGAARGRSRRGRPGGGALRADPRPRRSASRPSIRCA